MLVDSLVATACLALQAIAVAPLFAGPLTHWRKSIEAAFITDARFIVEHFPRLSWNPLWYLGFPFELFYTPLLPSLVALVGAATGDVLGAYRLVAAGGFALGAAGLYALARALGLSRAASLFATVVFVAAPSLSTLFLGVFRDSSVFTGAALPLPWRLNVLVEYGEGPHVFGLSLSLLAAAALLRYLQRGGAVWFCTTVALFVAVALTNLIAVLGVAVLGVGCAFATARGTRSDLQAVRLFATAAILSLVWYSPGFAFAVVGFSTPGGEAGGTSSALLPVILALVAFVTRQIRATPRVQIVAFWLIAFGVILASWSWANLPLAPQPKRYALEFDVAVAVGGAILAATLASRATHRFIVREAALAAAAFVVALASLPGWAGVQVQIGPDPQWREWSERKVALWLADHLTTGERAYLSGSHSFWVDVFADVPQVRGDVDFAGVDPWWTHVAYQINSANDPDTSVLWLRALAIRYAVVPGPESSEIYHDFANPKMFEGRLPLATNIDGARIYAVDNVHPTPTLIAKRDDLTPPSNAIDRPALERYVRALDAGLPTGRVDVHPTGIDGWDGGVDTPDGGTVLFRVAYDSGWQATVNDKPATLRPDAVGLLALDVPAGSYRLNVTHHVHRDLALSATVAFAFLAGAIAWRLRAAIALTSAAPRVVIGVIVALYAFALGVTTGFPKGTDAPMHLTRLKFVSDWFPHHNWLYVWAAGMPMFETYPALPYLAALPFVRLFGPELTLEALALLAVGAIGLGVYGHLIERGRPVPVALLAALMVTTSLAIWTWIVHGGVYARVVAVGFGALAWWAHAAALRTHRARWYAAAIILLAASLASHEAMGALCSFYLALVHLSARGARGLRGLAVIAGLTFLLAAPAIVPALESDVGGRFLGAVRTTLGPSPVDVLWSPVHVGLAAVLVPVGLIVFELRDRPRVVVPGIALLAASGYLFAPNLGIPTRFYYITGIDPFSTTFIAALVGTLVFAAVIPPPGTWRYRAALGFAAALVLANVLLGVPAFLSQHTYPQVMDTTAPAEPEAVSRRTLVVTGDDVEHRLLTLTASEAVWFNYLHRKPILRHYYDQGVLYPDWLAWAFYGIYTVPLSPTRVSVVADWFALDSLTVTPDQPAASELAKTPSLALMPATANAPIREFTVRSPSTVVVATAAPIIAIVADASGYDSMARLLFEGGATPNTQVPVWWSGTLADLPVDLVARASAVVVVGDHSGDAAAAAAMAQRLGQRGARVLWDVGGVSPRTLPAPWPATSLAGQAIARWDVRDSKARISESDFAPADYNGGPWGATVPSDLRDGAAVDLSLGGAPLIASTVIGEGRITLIGGNLFYHALDKASVAEQTYLRAYFGPLASRAAREPAWTFVNPEHREIEVDGSPIVLKEFLHRNWRATWRAEDGTVRALAIHYAGPALMLVIPPGPGTVSFEYQASTLELLSWVLFIGGIGILLWLAWRGRMRSIMA